MMNLYWFSEIKYRRKINLGCKYTCYNNTLRSCAELLVQTEDLVATQNTE